MKCGTKPNHMSDDRYELERKKMKTPQEEFCKSEFHMFLKSSIDLSSITWSDGDEPPDYYVDLSGREFAVEVTTLMENFQVDARSLSRIEIITSLWNMVDAVQEEAEAQNILRGTYTVSFSRPIENFGRHRLRIKREILEYVRSTQYLENAPEIEYLVDEIRMVSIHKNHDKSNKIVPLGPANAKWKSQAREEICQLINKCLSDKVHKLRNISLPKILLLRDAYHFADQEMHVDCTPQLALLPNFHTVFVIRNNEDGFVLHSEEANWLR
jgi:hypothetical protein